MIFIMTKKFLGLDFAMHGLYVASDEDDAVYPNFLRKAEKRPGQGTEETVQKAEGEMQQGKAKIARGHAS